MSHGSIPCWMFFFAFSDLLYSLVLVFAFFIHLLFIGFKVKFRAAFDRELALICVRTCGKVAFIILGVSVIHRIASPISDEELSDGRAAFLLKYVCGLITSWTFFMVRITIVRPVELLFGYRPLLFMMMIASYIALVFVRNVYRKSIKMLSSQNDTADQYRPPDFIYCTSEVKDVEITKEVKVVSRCVICYCNYARYALLPCGHLVFCEECTLSDKCNIIDTCPLCRHTALQCVHVFT
jgi:hypothetical protein